jgi:hypothetical protein
MLAVAILGQGCARQQPPAGAAEPPAGIPMAQVRPGMNTEQVSEILGSPNEQTNQMTGKRFIPYYMGPDAARFIWHYKGLGRVVFNVGSPFGGSPGVIKTEYDPSEAGASPSR